MQPPKSPSDNFVDAAKIIDASDDANLIPAVPGLERQSVDKLYKTRNRLASSEMSDIDPFNCAGLFGKLKSHHVGQGSWKRVSPRLC